MKTQINPTIKAHLIRSAFYVLLMLAVCVIPFALAQRNTNKRNAAKPQVTASLAAAGKQSGAPASVTGATQRKSGTVERNLPYDVRPLPPQAPKFPYSSVRASGPSDKRPAIETKPVSQLPINSSGPTGVCGLLVGSGLTLGFAPNNYALIANNTVSYTFSNSQAAPNDYAVFETHDPWGGTVLTDAITANGHTFSVFTPAQLGWIPIQ